VQGGRAGSLGRRQVVFQAEIKEPRPENAVAHGHQHGRPSVGCLVVGPALSASNAETLVRDEALDGAVLDINMGDTTSFSVASMLQARRVPFCFATGYGSAGVPAEMADAPVLPKPYTQQALARVLETLLR
jgi:DNA-binding LytR/AlgR family response regulator